MQAATMITKIANRLPRFIAHFPGDPEQCGHHGQCNEQVHANNSLVMAERKDSTSSGAQCTEAEDGPEVGDHGVGSAW